MAIDTELTEEELEIACNSILHLIKEEMVEIIDKMSKGLKVGNYTELISQTGYLKALDTLKSKLLDITKEK